ncbi:impact family protein [Xylona heveae TC161]|uniref:Impact family protein n=1 Tax=Xylona heveae (strain CBS 132557 / TC161) TaxID=1328760 RepID=A0A165AA02_XYLHT|nr:impact family protein [Xylona heveae TC161]KZF20151.1 impact family protein [Xylona heveae TC161]
MSEELTNEIEAINSIYGDSTLEPSEGEPDVYILHLPTHTVSVRLHFPSDYPNVPPQVLGTQDSGTGTRRGEATHVKQLVQDTLGTTFRPGEVCLFDLLEELRAFVDSAVEGQSEHDVGEEEDITEKPPWILSEVFTEKKSVFLARCAPVETPAQARQYIQHLLATDKKVAKATHNISAWRIKTTSDIIYQDFDDDGETAAGGRVLHLMQLMDLWNVMVVVTRWYGGIHLGPDRFRLINSAARDAFVRGDYVKDQTSSGKKKARK